MFGKKATGEMAKQLGGFIDEQQLTLQERLKIISEMMPVMGPFVAVQRIIITIVMVHWIAFAAQYMLSIWLEGYDLAGLEIRESLIEYGKMNIIWGPTLAAIGLYTAGGVGIFKGKFR